MSKNWMITKDIQPKRNKDELIKIRVINKAIRDMVRNGYITQQFADENREKLISDALKTLS